MPTDKIVLVTSVYDQGDILGDYLHWYLDLGVDFIIAQDLGSTDNSHDVLDRFARSGRVEWFTLPERDMRKYDTGTALAAIARDRHDAEWIIQCDADEFLSPEGRELTAILREAKENDCTVLSARCLNMTGAPLEQEQSAQRSLTLRIDRPAAPTPEQRLSGDLPAPFVLTGHPPKTIVRARALVNYGAGTHTATSGWGRTMAAPDLRFLHFPIRGFDKFERKIQNTAAWLRDNPHLEANWAWHWRRWIRLHQQGRLREEYDSQFVSPARSQELIRDGTCTIDETVAGWIGTRKLDLH